MINQLTSADKRIQIGLGTYASAEPLIRLHHAKNQVVIGRFCSIAHSVTIFSGGNHPMTMVSSHPLKLFFGVEDFLSWTNDCGDGDVTTFIGNDVWLGHGCTILSGARISDGAIIGAQSVVRGYVPPYGVVIGNPAALIRYRFEDEIIEQLLQLRWWDWPIEKIRYEVSIGSFDDVANFLHRNSK